jgi:catechol 2,3-dioxygenase-like lactoylglutathione lyase family enzyme
MVKKLDHINLVVSNLNKSISFFELLDFKVVKQNSLDSNFLSKVTGIKDAYATFAALQHTGSEVSIELIEYAQNQTISDESVCYPAKIGIRHIAFQVSCIDRLVDKLKLHGVDFLSDVQIWNVTGKKLVYFYGPDKILLELAEYPE